ncbi:transposase [Streptomyces sp. JNUCC 63]
MADTKGRNGATPHGRPVGRQCDGRQIKDGVDAWRSRPLYKIYAVLMIDAIVLKIRDGAASNQPVYIAAGINLKGERHGLGMCRY